MASYFEDALNHGVSQAGDLLSNFPKNYMDFGNSLYPKGNSWRPMDVNPVQSDISNYSPDQMQSFVNALGVGQGINNQNILAKQLQAQSMGEGPNPAMDQLAMTTGQNMRGQAGAMASQRGVSQNAGTMGMNVANQGASIQQQAAGQAAVMRANQQLAAQQQLAQLSQQQVGNYSNAVGNISNIYASNAQQGNAIRAQNAQSTNQGSVARMQSDTAMEQQKTGSKSAMGGGIMQGVGAAIPFIAAAAANKGGMIKGYAGGGEISGPGIRPLFSQSGTTIDPNGPKSMLGQSMLATDNGEMSKGFSSLGKGLGKSYQNYSARNSQVTTPMVGSLSAGAGEGSSMDQIEQTAYKGGSIHQQTGLKSGGNVKGKANVKGDSIKNDTVLTALSPGEIVIPRHITQGKNAPENAAKFVAAVLAKQGLGNVRTK